MQVILNSQYNSDEVTEFPSGIFPDLRQIGSQTTDGSGVATFSDFSVISIYIYI